MLKLSQKQKVVLSIILKHGAMASSAIFAEISRLGDELSLVTVKRALSSMAEQGLLAVSGAGPRTEYKVTVLGRLFAPVDARSHCALDPDKRFGLRKYNFDLFPSTPSELFDSSELELLNSATAFYRDRAKNTSEVIQKKELERLVIELAWKSSKIEGNTYTLLDTEKLILKHTEAPGHDKKEAQMILNHKDAFAFIHENPLFFREMTRVNLEKLHSILVKDLTVKLGVRASPVGVLGSTYQPLDNSYQIEEAIEELCRAILRADTPYSASILALLGISYIQPFEDGNKRASRLMANAILLAHTCAPLSYRSVDETEYREAMLVFYEINSLIPFKKIFINQYDFAARTYSAR